MHELRGSPLFVLSITVFYFLPFWPFPKRGRDITSSCYIGIPWHTQKNNTRKNKNFNNFKFFELCGNNQFMHSLDMHVLQIIKRGRLLAFGALDLLVWLDLQNIHNCILQFFFLRHVQVHDNWRYNKYTSRMNWWTAI